MKSLQNFIKKELRIGLNKLTTEKEYLIKITFSNLVLEHEELSNSRKLQVDIFIIQNKHILQ